MLFKNLVISSLLTSLCGKAMTKCLYEQCAHGNGLRVQMEVSKAAHVDMFKGFKGIQRDFAICCMNLTAIIHM